MSTYDEETGLKPGYVSDGDEEEEPLLAEANEEKIQEEILEKTGGTDVVQFSAPMYFAEEDEGLMTIDIIRLGSMQGKVAVKYACRDVSAIHGENYTNTTGQLVFADGEHTKSIHIPILSDELWTPTQEFKVYLESPQNCTLGTYLLHSRVKILNTNKFPNDLYEKDIVEGVNSGSFDHMSMWIMFWQYWKSNHTSMGLQRQTALILVMDQLSNVLLFVTLWVGVYIVDTIFAGKGTSHRLLVPDRYHTAMIVALWYVVPSVLLYGWDCAKTYIDIKGHARELLQSSLIKCYFDYTHESRSRVTPSEITASIDGSADQIAEGYVAVLNIAGLVGKIVTVEIFIVFFQPEPLAILSVLIMVVALMAFTAVRARVAQRAQERVEEQHALVDLVVDEATRKFELVHDYSRRSVMTDAFARAIRTFSERKVPETISRYTTAYTTQFLSGIFIALYIVAMTPAVLDGDLSLGIFLATITIFGTYLADAIKDLNTQLMCIIDSFAPLKDFIFFLNLELNLLQLKKVNRARREHTKLRRTSVLSESADALAKRFSAQNELGEAPSPPGSHPSRPDSPSSSTLFKSDLIPIEVKDIAFEYLPGIPVFSGVNVDIPQGRMVAVTGPHKAGKSTFMDLLANIRCPTTGTVMVPSHLRVLNVTRRPFFLRTSLLNNLCLGLASHARIDVDQVKGIVKLCGIPEMLDVLEEDVRLAFDSHLTARGDDGALINAEIHYDEESKVGHAWLKSLTQSQMIRLHIARALIANPNIIILQRSLEGLHGDAALEMIAVLRDHVNQRGLCLPPVADINKRRPRNVFFSTDDPLQANEADVILELDPVSKLVVPKSPSRAPSPQYPRS